MTDERILTRISPDILDTIGRDFRFSHGKGVAEWLKNSLDNYLRFEGTGAESLSGGWPAFVCLVDAPEGASRAEKQTYPRLAVIDFGGTRFQDVEQFFLYWGDTSAATSGGRFGGARVTGGHGNGGKFYMREMWKAGARFLTWRDGKATSLLVDKKSDGTTGAWEKKDQSCDAVGAMVYAVEDEGLASAILACFQDLHPAQFAELQTGARGFTVVYGRGAKQLKNANDVVVGAHWAPQPLIDDIRQAPQARRPIRELNISVLVNGSLALDRLVLEQVGIDPEWQPQEWSMPEEVIIEAEFQAGADKTGVLMLGKAPSLLSGRSRAQNSIQIVDDSGNPLGSYDIKTLPLPGHSAILQFLYGDLRLLMPRIKELVRNDRERLIESPTTQAILAWVGERVWEYAKGYEDTRRQSAQQQELSIASELNALLNKYAHRFLQELETEMMVDYVESPGGGGPGPKGHGTGKAGHGDGHRGANGSGGSKGSGGTDAEPGTSEKKRTTAFPRVLLSGHDPDPANPDGKTRVLTEAHPPVYQDDADRRYNIWWINTEHPFAAAALRQGGAKGPRFRSYHLFMFAQVVQIETLRMGNRRQAEMGMDVIENEIQRVSNDFLASLPPDLQDALLDDA